MSLRNKFYNFEAFNESSSREFAQNFQNFCFSEIRKQSLLAKILENFFLRKLPITFNDLMLE
jgi:hypothetical protein